MPFKSEKQRRYLHANHPKIAKRWERDYADGGITRIPFFTGAQADTKKGKAMSPGTSASGKTRHTPSGNGGDGGKKPPVVPLHTGPTQAEIEAEKKRKVLEEQQRKAQQFSDFYKKFKKGTKKKSKYLDTLLANDPLLETYKAKGLLDWDNIKSFDEDKRKTAEEIEKMKSLAWGYTRPWTGDESLFIADIDKFQPEWTPGATQEGRLNKRIAETIGHEARHQVLGNVVNRGQPWGWEGQTMWTGDPYSQKVEIDLTQDENSPYSKYMDKGGLEYERYSKPVTSHELLTRMGDYQSYNDPRIYKDIYGKVHGWMPEHLTSDVANKFYDAAEQFTKDTKARTAGEKYENIDPVMVEGLKRAYPDEDIDESLKEMSTRDVMDLLQENYQYYEDKKEMMEGAKGGVARKKYSTGGILDIDGSEEITTEEGNDISLVDESEIGVSTLFRAKNGGYAVQGGVKNYLGEQEMVSAPKYWQSAPDHPETELTYITKPEKDLLVKADLHGSLHGSVNKGPQGLTSLNGWGDAEHGFGGNEDKGETSSDSGWSDNRPTMADVAGPTTGGDQEDDVAQMMHDMSITQDHSPDWTGSDRGWVVSEDEETEIGGADYIGPKDKVRIHNEILNRKKKYDSPLEQGKRVFSVYKSFPKPTGIPLIDIPMFGYFAWKQNEKKKERIAEIDADLELLDKIGAPKHHHSVDTIYQKLTQEKLDLTQPSSRDEDTSGDGPEAPVVAPVTEEIEDSYAMAGDWLQSYRDLKAKQALSASLQEKWADEREWQQNTMFLNSGGLANLFRVKN